MVLVRDKSDIRGFWKVMGIEQPLAPLLTTSDPAIVVLKVPAHKTWIRIGQRLNVPTEYQVYRILGADPDRFTVEKVAEFSPASKRL